MRMGTSCPSCGGEMKYYPPFYTCRSCGLSATRSELDDLREQYRDQAREEIREEVEKEYEEEKGRKPKVDRKKQKEMLDWYTSSKKK